jgi:dienelactone hydrolase
MASIIPGYNYDIFISYRQKDNKGDRWVSEFVDALKDELESTFKEEISVYFDISPHDGLLETHDVDESLKEKLKCLVFIPILSRTYCDPKAFAWDHEFKAFIDQASHDQFGLKVRLRGGNVANRVLPVQIHDLDNQDIKLCESILGGVLRGIEFIYKEAGVNRPLRSNEENPHDNLNHTIYRNQINKLAIAINEILISLKTVDDSKSDKDDAPKETSNKELKDINKQEPAEEKRYSKEGRFYMPRYLKILAPIVLILIVVMTGVWLSSGKQKKDWARYVQIPEIQKLVDENTLVPIRAYEMATEVEKIIPNDSSLKELWPRISTNLSIETEPEGADIFWKEYGKPDGNWNYLGTSPLQNARIPNNFLRIQIVKQDYQTITYSGPPQWGNSGFNWTALNKVKLDRIDSLPENMVRILGINENVGEFLMDRYEVTNKQFKQFIDSGGYTIRKYWTNPIYLNGREIKWEEAMKLFKDNTGYIGPATWEVGNYPEGMENHPVAGVSWYEAAAYAEFMNKKLPSISHWRTVAEIPKAMNIIPLSNFNQASTLPVGEMEGISSFGVYDMAGNVREWCINESNVKDQRYILGGGWNDPTYWFIVPITLEAMDRSVSNGFRCIKELPGDTSFDRLSGMVQSDYRNYREEKPVNDNVFDIITRQYLYDKIPLDPVVSILPESNFCKIEKVTFDAAYSEDKLIIYVFTPKDFAPPYQPIIFFPGAQALGSRASITRPPRDYIVKSGRALILPIYKGTYERSDDLKSQIPDESILFKEHVIMWGKDLGRTIDYLESRSDMLADKIGYLGFSWGARIGGIWPAVEPRLKVIVLVAGGLRMQKTLPEVDPFNFLPRIHQPVLMIDGRYDPIFPAETSSQPMFDFIGTNKQDKKIVYFDYPGHSFLNSFDLKRETLTWYDKYLGPVQ